MTVQSKQLIEEALLEATLEQYKDVPAENEIDHEFSKQFERNMKGVISMTKENKAKAAPNSASHHGITTLKRIVLIAALISMLTVTALAAPAIREFFVKFFMEEWGYGYAITFDPEQAANAPDTIEQYMVPEYIPDEYQIISENTGKTNYSVWYSKSDSENILFDQYCIKDSDFKNNWMFIENEIEGYEIAVMNGYQIKKLAYNEYIAYVWTDNCYFYTLQTPISVTITEVEMIISSVCPTN